MKDKDRNTNKQVRLREDILNRIAEIVSRSPFTEADVLRAAIEAGLPLLESGDYNPFSAKKAHPTAMRGMSLAGLM